MDEVVLYNLRCSCGECNFAFSFGKRYSFDDVSSSSSSKNSGNRKSAQQPQEFLAVKQSDFSLKLQFAYLQPSSSCSSSSGTPPNSFRATTPFVTCCGILLAELDSTARGANAGSAAGALDKYCDALKAGSDAAFTAITAAALSASDGSSRDFLRHYRQRVRAASISNSGSGNGSSSGININNYNNNNNAGSYHQQQQQRQYVDPAEESSSWKHIAQLQASDVRRAVESRSSSMAKLRVMSKTYKVGEFSFPPQCSLELFPRCRALLELEEQKQSLEQSQLLNQSAVTYQISQRLILQVCGCAKITSSKKLLKQRQVSTSANAAAAAASLAAESGGREGGEEEEPVAVRTAPLRFSPQQLLCLALLSLGQADGEAFEPAAASVAADSSDPSTSHRKKKKKSASGNHNGSCSSSGGNERMVNIILPSHGNSSSSSIGSGNNVDTASLPPPGDSMSSPGGRKPQHNNNNSIIIISLPRRFFLEKNEMKQQHQQQPLWHLCTRQFCTTTHCSDLHFLTVAVTLSSTSSTTATASPILIANFPVFLLRERSSVSAAAAAATASAAATAAFCCSPTTGSNGASAAAAASSNSNTIAGQKTVASANNINNNNTSLSFELCAPCFFAATSFASTSISSVGATSPNCLQKKQQEEEEEEGKEELDGNNIKLENAVDDNNGNNGKRKPKKFLHLSLTKKAAPHVCDFLASFPQLLDKQSWRWTARQLAHEVALRWAGQGVTGADTLRQTLRHIKQRFYPHLLPLPGASFSQERKARAVSDLDDEKNNNNSKNKGSNNNNNLSRAPAAVATARRTSSGSSNGAMPASESAQQQDQQQQVRLSSLLNKKHDAWPLRCSKCHKTPILPDALQRRMATTAKGVDDDDLALLDDNDDDEFDDTRVPLSPWLCYFVPDGAQCNATKGCTGKVWQPDSNSGDGCAVCKAPFSLFSRISHCRYCCCSCCPRCLPVERPPPASWGWRTSEPQKCCAQCDHEIKRAQHAAENRKIEQKRRRALSSIARLATVLERRRSSSSNHHNHNNNGSNILFGGDSSELSFSSPLSAAASGGKSKSPSSSPSPPRPAAVSFSAASPIALGASSSSVLSALLSDFIAQQISNDNQQLVVAVAAAVARQLLAEQKQQQQFVKSSAAITSETMLTIAMRACESGNQTGAALIAEEQRWTRLQLALRLATAALAECDPVSLAVACGDGATGCSCSALPPLSLALLNASHKNPLEELMEKIAFSIESYDKLLSSSSSSNNNNNNNMVGGEGGEEASEDMLFANLRSGRIILDMNALSLFKYCDKLIDRHRHIATSFNIDKKKKKKKKGNGNNNDDDDDDDDCDDDDDDDEDPEGNFSFTSITSSKSRAAAMEAAEHLEMIAAAAQRHRSAIENGVRARACLRELSRLEVEGDEIEAELEKKQMHLRLLRDALAEQRHGSAKKKKKKKKKRRGPSFGDHQHYNNDRRDENDDDDDDEEEEAEEEEEEEEHDDETEPRHSATQLSLAASASARSLTAKSTTTTTTTTTALLLGLAHTLDTSVIAAAPLSGPTLSSSSCSPSSSVKSSLAIAEATLDANISDLRAQLRALCVRQAAALHFLSRAKHRVPEIAALPCIHNQQIRLRCIPPLLQQVGFLLRERDDYNDVFLDGAAAAVHRPSSSSSGVGDSTLKISIVIYRRLDTDGGDDTVLNNQQHKQEQLQSLLKCYSLNRGADSSSSSSSDEILRKRVEKVMARESFIKTALLSTTATTNRQQQKQRAVLDDDDDDDCSDDTDDDDDDNERIMQGNRFSAPPPPLPLLLPLGAFSTADSVCLHYDHPSSSDATRRYLRALIKKSKMEYDNPNSNNQPSGRGGMSSCSHTSSDEEKRNMELLTRFPHLTLNQLLTERMPEKERTVLNVFDMLFEFVSGIAFLHGRGVVGFAPCLHPTRLLCVPEIDDDDVVIGDSNPNNSNRLPSVRSLMRAQQLFQVSSLLVLPAPSTTTVASVDADIDAEDARMESCVSSPSSVTIHHRLVLCHVADEVPLPVAMAAEFIDQNPLAASAAQQDCYALGNCLSWIYKQLSSSFLENPNNKNDNSNSPSTTRAAEEKGSASHSPSAATVALLGFVEVARQLSHKDLSKRRTADWAKSQLQQALLQFYEVIERQQQQRAALERAMKEKDMGQLLDKMERMRAAGMIKVPVYWSGGIAFRGAGAGVSIGGGSRPEKTAGDAAANSGTSLILLSTEIFAAAPPKSLPPPTMPMSICKTQFVLDEIQTNWPAVFGPSASAAGASGRLLLTKTLSAAGGADSSSSSYSSSPHRLLLGTATRVERIENLRLFQIFCAQVQMTVADMRQRRRTPGSSSDGGGVVGVHANNNKEPHFSAMNRRFGLVLGGPSGIGGANDGGSGEDTGALAQVRAHYLFYNATSIAAARDIVTNGFSPSSSLHFTDDPAFAADAGNRRSAGTAGHVMILARVILGDVYVTARPMMISNNNHGNNSGKAATIAPPPPGYDSVLRRKSATASREFFVKSNTMTLPEFVIHFA